MTRFVTGQIEVPADPAVLIQNYINQACEILELRAERAGDQQRLFHYEAEIKRLEDDIESWVAQAQSARAERDELLERCVQTRLIYKIEIRDKFGLINAAITKAEGRK